MIPWLRFKPASVLNLCSTIEGNNALVVEGVLQELLGIVLPILDELVVPGHPVGPGNVLLSLKLRVGDGPNFRESKDSLTLGDILQLVEFTFESTVVTSVAIVVNSGNIALVISGIPLGIGGVANPHDVVNVVYAGDAVVDDVPELLEGSWALSSPPEPCTFRLVKWAEENRNVCICQTLELDRNSIDIPNQ